MGRLDCNGFRHCFLIPEQGRCRRCPALPDRTLEKKRGKENDGDSPDGSARHEPEK